MHLGLPNHRAESHTGTLRAKTAVTSVAKVEVERMFSIHVPSSSLHDRQPSLSSTYPAGAAHLQSASLSQFNTAPSKLHLVPTIISAAITLTTGANAYAQKNSERRW